MCGVCGHFPGRGCSCPPPAPAAVLAALAHRGPDGGAHYAPIPCSGAFIGLTALSLVGADRQPHVDAPRRTALVCNGEVYNHADL